MIKKVNADEVCLGMYIHELRGNWLEHPFWRKSFKLDDPKDLQKLIQSGVNEIWIDTDKGFDVAAAVITESTKEPKEFEPVKPEPAKAPPVVKKQISFDDELVAAKKIHTKAKKVVTSMFGDARMGKALDVQGAVVLVEDIQSSIERNPSALLSLARLKNANEYTYLHSVAVCMLMIALAKQLKLPEDQARQAGVAGLLHDIGKMAIPSQVLDKPGRLTDEEFNVVKQHPQRGWEILKASYQVDDVALDVCLHHHERVDGRGYPEKITGDDLSLFARMGAVCDVYDAISSDRCYKKAWGPAESISKMTAWREGHFDEAIFHAFVKTIGIYPSGTLLKLKSGRLGVVLGQSKKSLVAPIVKVFFSIRANMYIPVEIVDLSKGLDSIDSIEDPLKWQLDVDRLQGIIE